MAEEPLRMFSAGERPAIDSLVNEFTSAARSAVVAWTYNGCRSETNDFACT